MTPTLSLPSPFDFAVFRELECPVHRLLLLDYDGTLAPFHVERAKATPYSGVREALISTSKSRGSRTVVISGRPVAEVRGLLGLEVGVEIWGAHGWERLTPLGDFTAWPLSTTSQAELRDAWAAARRIVAEELIEVKTASVAVHLRPLSAVEAGHARRAIHDEWGGRSRRTTLVLTEFDGGLELRDLSRTKATAVETLLGESPSNALAAYLGDDLTDEDAFACLKNRGWALLISRQTRPSIATFSLCPPHEVTRFIEEWGAWA